MASSISLTDNAGNPFPISGEMLKKALPTAWCVLRGDGTILDSYNMDVDLLGSYSYKAIFDTPTENENYTISTSINGDGDVNNYSAIIIPERNEGNITKTVNSFSFTTATYSGTNSRYSTAIISVVIHGGLN